GADLVGNGTGILFLAQALLEDLGEPHGGVGLVVAKLVILRDGDQRIDLNAERGSDGVAEGAVEGGGDGAHGREAAPALCRRRGAGWYRRRRGKALVGRWSPGVPAVRNGCHGFP